MAGSPTAGDSTVPGRERKIKCYKTMILSEVCLLLWRMEKENCDGRYQGDESN